MDQVRQGTKPAINTENLEDPEYIIQQRGLHHLTTDDLELLMNHIEPLMSQTRHEKEINRQKILKFVDYAVTHVSQRQFMMDKAAQFDQMKLKEKTAALEQVLMAMLKDEDKAEDAYAAKCFMDILSTHVGLVYAFLINQFFYLFTIY